MNTAAVGNGNGQSEDSYSRDVFDLFNGRALVVLRSTRKAGEITLSSEATGLTAASIVLASKDVAAARTELR